MTDFSRSRSAFVEQKVDDKIDKQRTGTVQSVYEHLEDGDNSNFEADVVTDAGTRIERVAPMKQPSSGRIDVPKVGDTVLIGFRAGESPEPIIMGYVYTTNDRPPVGKAGMTRDSYESGNSPLGDGNLYVTGYTSYDIDPANKNKSEANPEETFVRVTKRTDDEPDPSSESAVPAKIEFYDAPAEDSAHVSVELNKADSSDSTATWGIKFDAKTGSFKIVDPSGYGITSDGNGNFVWNHKSIDFDETTDGQLSL